MSVCGVIVAAGTGSRMGAGMNKVYLPLGGRCVLWYTINAFAKSGAADSIVVVTGGQDIDRCRALLGEFNLEWRVVEGGATRQQSVLNGLAAAGGDFAAVHDGARALVTPEQIRAVVAAAKECRAAALGVRPKDTLKIADADGFITRTIERETAYQIQTPQVFMREALIAAHRRAIADGFSATDDCMIMERAGTKIKVVEASYENIKLTTPEDIYTAERILKQRGEWY